ncbi:MAG: hypothetical protein ACK4VY_09220 [Brevundimonas sp.]
MFGKFKRHNDRKGRASRWFEIERAGDMQTFDLQSLAGALGAYFHAVMRDRAQRRATRVAARTAVRTRLSSGS